MKHDIFRSTTTSAAYKEYLANLPTDIGCIFCSPSEGGVRVIKDNGAFYLVQNRFPYEIWDGFKVLDHLFLAPKRHVQTIGEFNEVEDKQYLETVKEYENKGYCIYARAAKSKSKSIPHQHTHFIKISDESVSSFIYHHKIGRRLTK